MIEVTLGLLVVSLFAYALFGGADFGAGVLEGMLPADHRERVDAALSPVWEANHVWLIAAIVIAFVGFPEVFATASTLLHVPLSLALLGIVARGTAFTFRHYDPEPPRAGRGYAWLFRVSSALTPFVLGAAFVTLGSGRLTHQGNFTAIYLRPWLGLYPISAGLFAVALFTFVAATWLATEHVKDSGQLPYLRLARRLHAATIALGGLTVVAAQVTGAPLLYDFAASPVAIGLVGSATVLVGLVAWAFHRARIGLLRVLVGAQVAAIFGAYVVAQYPAMIRFADAPELLVRTAAAPPASLLALIGCLAFALTLVVPGLVYLLRVYKTEAP